MAPTTQQLSDDVDRLLKALTHDLRFGILTVLRDREASPTELAEVFDVPLKRVCEHVALLQRDDYIELVETDERRGGPMHIYRATTRPFLSTADSEDLPRANREGVSASILQAHLLDLIRAMKAGTVNDRVERVLVRQPGVLDDQGWKEMDDAAVLHMDEVERIYADAANRLARSGGTGDNAVSGTLILPMPESAD